MKTARRAGTVAGLGAIVCSLGLASVAWACSPTFNLKTNPATGPANSEVTVTGTAFTSGDPSSDKGNLGPVEIRWNSITGARLGSAAGPSFKVTVTIPDAKRGFYSIVSVQRSTDTGEVVGKASAAFEVTAPASSSTAPPPSSDSAEQPGSTAAQPTNPEASRGSAPETSPASGSSEPAGAATASTDGTATAPTAGARASAARKAAKASGTAAPTPAVVGPAGEAPAPNAATEPPAAEPVASVSPPPATVWGDLWQFSEPGVQAWPTHSLATPGLADSPASGDSSSTGLAVGAALFSAGLAALGATPVLGLRRRRVVQEG